MHAGLRHPNVVSCLGIVIDPPAIVSEYCARGSLTQVLRGSGGDVHVHGFTETQQIFLLA